MPTTHPLIVRTAERPGGIHPSEDRIFQTDNAVMVLDGATQAFPLERTGAWIADELGRRLVAALEDQPSIDLRRLLRSAIADVVAEYELEPGKSPSTTVSIARFREDTVDVLVLCDSPVVILDTSNRITAVSDDRLADLVASLFRPGGLRDMTKKERVERMEALESNRNQPGGFWCVSASPEAADEAVVKRVRRTDCQAIMLMTDGVSAIVDSYETLSWRDAIDVALEDPDRLVELVHETELQDPNAEKWPRGKIHDDKAVAVVMPQSPPDWSHEFDNAL